jgi:hypothetical protein
VVLTRFKLAAEGIGPRRLGRVITSPGVGSSSVAGWSCLSLSGIRFSGVFGPVLPRREDEIGAPFAERINAVVGDKGDGE